MWPFTKRKNRTIKVQARLNLEDSKIPEKRTEVYKNLTYQIGAWLFTNKFLDIKTMRVNDKIVFYTELKVSK